jgi:hypothetical protein
MSDYAQLSARQSITPNNLSQESDIFLKLKNPLSDPVEIDWEIGFPFPVDPANRNTGKDRLDPYGNTTKSWTTNLAQLRRHEQQAASEEEIVVRLKLSPAGNHIEDRTRGTLRQLHSLPK